MLRSLAFRHTTNSLQPPPDDAVPDPESQRAGYLGLYTIAVLAELEDRIEAPLATRFDLIAGTSVGGIIALGIANEVKATQIKHAFERDGDFLRPETTQDCSR